jgi:DNA-binding IscR family transcriptional regulator
LGGEPESFTSQCVIDQAMRQAELAWRRALARQSLADLNATVEREAPGCAGSGPPLVREPAHLNQETQASNKKRHEPGASRHA